MYRDDNKKLAKGVLPPSQLDDIGIAFFVSTLEGEIVNINNTFLEMFGYTRFEEIENLNLKQHFYSNPGSRDALLTLLTQKKQVKNYRLLLMKNNGAKLYTQVSKKLVVVDGITLIETCVRDISDTILKEYELKKEIKELKGNTEKLAPDAFSNELKFRYLRGIGHGVRTPVTSLLGYLTMLENKLYKNNDEYNEILSESKTAVTKLNETVNSLIDLTRIETGSLQLYEEKFSLTEEITSVDSVLHAIFGEESYFRFELDKNIPRVMRGDNLRFRQILIGMLKYIKEVCHPDEIITKFLLAANDSKKVKLGVEITLSGNELNIDEINRLSQSLDNPRELNNIEEHRLGFFIANEYIRALGGNLKIESGSNLFTLKFTSGFFPDDLATGSEKTDDDINIPVKRASSDFPEEAKKILLVEDDKGNRGVEEKILRNAGYYVYSTGSGREAVKELEKNDYDIVLMDIAMEDVDGITATKMIREFPGVKGNIPVIAVTAHCSMQDRQKCLDAGMNDYISKPINFKYLKLTIEQWIKKNENVVVSL